MAEGTGCTPTGMDGYITENEKKSKASKLYVRYCLRNQPWNGNKFVGRCGSKTGMGIENNAPSSR
jgi:hypothetical protein